MRLNVLLLVVVSFLFAACSSSESGSSSSTSLDAGCTTVRSFTGSTITITGSANYEFRINGNGVINSTIATPNLPIRQAQVVIYNSSGSEIQCGSTNDSGNFSVIVPQIADNYTVSVDSRIYNSMMKAGVLNNPTEQDVHSITTTLAGTASASVGTLTATASGEIKGGAFNILDKIYGANLYLLTNTAGCSGSFTGCSPFTDAPAVSIYWDAGVNPGSYFGAGALSFYLPGARELYILGGVGGNTNSSDCDHFDNSIILHEYGHFIEDVFADTDSPGGTHTGNAIIDARLAWGEGWANFFQAATLNNPIYRDTSGNISGSSSVYFDEDLETPENDIPTQMGEGNFREFSITRLLWDSIDVVNEGAGVDTVSGTFAELWTIFTSTTTGLKNSSYVFRNMGLFHTLQQALGVTNWSSLRTGENQRGNQNDYSRAVASSSSACTPASVTIQAANNPGGSTENGTAARSNQFDSNDFYRYYHPGGAFSFRIDYATTPTAADLDVYIFRNSYQFTSSSSSSVAASATTNVTMGTTSASETISTSLSAGWYMINIRVDTASGLPSPADYSMTLNGSNLCPN